ncbi:hypothetical protein BDW62DRAFT_204003 [Aspergillus aurantiobrunneus]
MLVLIILLVGVALFSHRHYKAVKSKEASRVVVKGHTFSENVEQKPEQDLSRPPVENVRQCCVIGAGRVGAVTGLVLASQNPEVQFCVVDSNERVISAWNSDTPPFVEAGVEDLLFDDACLDGNTIEQSSKETVQIDRVERRRKLPNLTFSTNVHAGVTAAELVFLCVEMEPGSDELNHSYLDRTLQTIAHASTGHKIIVQRTTAPYGATQYIKNHLEQISSPTATFTTLTSPDFSLPGSITADTLTPRRVIIGHIYAPATSVKSITALKRLYTPWVGDERIVTMDAWSAELGRMGSKAAVAQQVAAAGALGMACGATEASMANVGWMLGVDLGVRAGMGRALRDEVRCLGALARGAGMEAVAGYWQGVLRMEEERCRGLVKGVQGVKTVAVVGVEDRDMIVVVLGELRRAGAVVRVWDGVASKEQVQEVIQGVTGSEGITVAESLQDACSGCSAVLLHGSWRVDEGWQAIADSMEQRKVLNIGGTDAGKTRQLGLDVMH